MIVSCARTNQSQQQEFANPMIVTAIKLIMNAIQKDEGDLEYLREQPIFRCDRGVYLM